MLALGGVVGQAVDAAGGVVVPAVGEDGDGLPAAARQAGEVGAGGGGHQLGPDPPGPTVDLKGGGSGGVGYGAHAGDGLELLGEHDAEARLQGALPDPAGDGLVLGCPGGRLRVEVCQGLVLGLPQQLADDAEGGGPGDLAESAVGLEAAVAHALVAQAALASLQVVAGDDEQAPQGLGGVQVGEVPGASGHGVVQEQGRACVAALPALDGVGSGGDLQVGRCPAGGQLQAQEEGGPQGVQGEAVSGVGQGQDEGDGLGLQVAHEVDLGDVLQGVGAPPAPGPVLAGGAGPGGPVEFAAGLAQAEVVCGHLLPGQAVHRIAAGGLARVEPAQREPAVAGGPEAVGLHPPLALDPPGIEVGQGQHLEAGTDPVIVGVPDAGVVLGDVGEDAGQAQHPARPPDVGDGGIQAPVALAGRRGRLLLGGPDVDVAAGLAAEPPLGLLRQV